MSEYILAEQSIPSNHNIIFLCGVVYKKKANDKRSVLKKFLKTISDKNYAIILEENFSFGNNQDYLSYDDIFLKDLTDIENLTGIFADCVTIIHESQSTASELGMFATNDMLHGKICIMIPNVDSVEEDKISSFLRLAYFRKDSHIKCLTFYPEIVVQRTSMNKSDYHTYFVNNAIGMNLAKAILEVLRETSSSITNVSINKVQFHNLDLSHQNVISYFVDDTLHAHVYIPARVVKIHIIAFFNSEDYKTEMRKAKELKDHVTYIENMYIDIIKNTLKERAEKFTNIFIEHIRINNKGSIIEFRCVIAYTLYLLQAMGMINLISSGTDQRKRKVQINTSFEKIYTNYSGFLIKNEVSKFGRMFK